MVGVEDRRLGRGASNRWVDSAWELCDSICLIHRSLRCRIACIATAEVDVLGRVWDLLSGSLVFDEGQDILLGIAVFEGKAYLLPGLFRSLSG